MFSIPISSKLSKTNFITLFQPFPFGFVRIDFLLADDNFYIGEITHYPTAGFGKMTPTKFDFELGKYWKLK